MSFRSSMSFGADARRAATGVTVAIYSLEGRGVIENSRGAIKVIDRGGLEEIANADVPEAEYKGDARRLKVQ